MRIELTETQRLSTNNLVLIFSQISSPHISLTVLLFLNRLLMLLYCTTVYLPKVKEKKPFNFHMWISLRMMMDNLEMKTQLNFPIGQSLHQPRSSHYRSYIKHLSHISFKNIEIQLNRILPSIALSLAQSILVHKQISTS